MKILIKFVEFVEFVCLIKANNSLTVISGIALLHSHLVLPNSMWD